MFGAQDENQLLVEKNSRQKYYLPQQSSPPLPASLSDLLSRTGLQQYRNLFETNSIDLYSFLILSEDDFRSIGITLLPHLKQLSVAQLRYHESVEIRSTQERLFADWLLNEREMYLRKILELEDKIKFFEYQENWANSEFISHKNFISIYFCTVICIIVVS